MDKHRSSSHITLLLMTIQSTISIYDFVNVVVWVAPLRSRIEAHGSLMHTTPQLMFLSFLLFLVSSLFETTATIVPRRSKRGYSRSGSSITTKSHKSRSRSRGGAGWKGFFVAPRWKS
jgi:hypothetical protein